MRLFATALLAACTAGSTDTDPATAGDADGDGWAEADGDCDDGDASVNPGEREIWYDGVDQDCDGVDADQDGDGVLVDVDCDDADAAVHPGAEETCNGVDDDCDGEVDDGADGDLVAYLDADGDGHGIPDETATYCATPPDGFAAVDDDCDDADASVFPGADEYCDDVDQDCDGALRDDPVDGVAWYPDADADGYGSDAGAVRYCEGEEPDGLLPSGGDCDDADAAVRPDADETCDGVDQDCDAVIDDDPVDGSVYWPDADADGWGDAAAPLAACAAPDGYVANGDDCDDTDRAIRPDATEYCGDGIDSDCDGDESRAVDAGTWYADADADGYGDDSSPIAACEAPAGTVADGGDCDDAAAGVNPGAPETCDGEDDDCDGETDEADATDAATWYRDADGDGHGDPAVTEAACDAPAGYVASGDDCDDGDAAVSPAAAETCDGADQDCDGDVDEGAVDATTWWVDADLDGYGSDAATQDACDVPSGYADNADDCDDADDTVNPAATEADDLVDQDCDGWVDEDFLSAGDVVISEVARQSWVGGTATNDAATWFELYNAGGRDVDLSNWLLLRTASAGTDLFYVDPADGVVLAAGDHAVFCKSEDYAAVTTSASTLVCDYVWGDASQASTWAGTYGDNTFNLQRDTDTLRLLVEGDASSGWIVDEVTWTYGTGTDWPRDATRSMSLDPARLDATDNDDVSSWCSTAKSTSYRWYDAAVYDEYGSPGAANYDCP